MMRRRTSHAVMRARRRYGRQGKSAIALVLALKEAVKQGTAKLRRRYPDGKRALFEARVRGRKVRFIYDHLSGMVVTLLPPRGWRVRGGVQGPGESPEAEGAPEAGAEPT